MTGYFVAQYIATALALLAVGLREYRGEGKLSRSDLNSISLTFVLLVLSYFVFNHAHEYLRIPLTMLTLMGAAWVFWKMAMSELERKKIIQEVWAQRQRFSRSTQN
jgi:hypothetical protein